MTTIKLRRGTAAQWTAADPILAAGEPGFETDTGKHKIGDGVTAWSGLSYFIDEAALSATYVPSHVVIGADATGATDSSAAIQAALNAANAAGGGSVYLPPGTYLINTNLTVYSNTTFYGAGRASKLLTTDSVSRVHIGIAANASNVVIRDLACVGPGDQSVPTNSQEPNAILLSSGTQQVTVRNCFVKDIAGFGIGVSAGCTDTLIEGNHLEGTGNSGLADGHAIVTESPTRLIIHNNTIRNCRYRGIEVYSGTAAGVTDVTVSGNTIYNCVGGLAVFASSSGVGFVRDISIVGNVIDTITSAVVGIGIWVAANADHVTVSANAIYNCTIDGIQVTPQVANTTIKKCAVIGNTVRHSGRYGITTDGATYGHMTIGNNIVDDSYSNGIYLNAANFVTVQGNVCTDNGRQATAGTDYAGIWGNTASRCSVGGNVCRDTRTGTSRTQTVGIYLTNASDYNYIGGNVCTNNVNGQIVLSGTNNVNPGNITS